MDRGRQLPLQGAKEVAARKYPLHLATAGASLGHTAMCRCLQPCMRPHPQGQTHARQVLRPMKSTRQAIRRCLQLSNPCLLAPSGMGRLWGGGS